MADIQSQVNEIRKALIDLIGLARKTGSFELKSLLNETDLIPFEDSVTGARYNINLTSLRELLGGGKFIDGTDPLDAVYTDGNVVIGGTVSDAKVDIQTTDPTLKRLKINDELLLDENGRLILGNPTLAPSKFTISQLSNGSEDFLLFESREYGGEDDVFRVNKIGGIRQLGLPEITAHNSLGTTSIIANVTTDTVFFRNYGAGNVLKLRSNNINGKVLSTEEGGVDLDWGENLQKAGLIMIKGGKVLVYGQGDNTQDDSAQFQVNSNKRGFLPPRMTSAERLAIPLPAIGLMAYQTDGTEGVYQYKSTGWVIV